MWLNVHSQYSLRYGTMDIQTIVDTACKLGITKLVLTDINNSTGCMEFIRKCRERQIEPVIGIEFRKNDELKYIGIAKNKEGMRELNKFLSYHNISATELPERPPAFENAYVIYAFNNRPEILAANEYVGIRHSELNRLFGKRYAHLNDKLVVLHSVTFAGKIEYRLHEYLRAIDHNTLLTKVGADQRCRPDEHFVSATEIAAQFEQYPFILHNTVELLANCSTLEYTFGKLNKKTFTGTKKDDVALLQKLALEGLAYRYGKENKEALKRIRHELKVIEELDFCAYFLITWDFIRYSMGRGYYHVGRGSGANSIVAYCLRITDVDPIYLDLYFERFLNSKRTSPPDFDVDYSWDEREDVQDYIFKRYGEEHTALLGTMTTFKARSTIREIGKVLGLPKAEIDSFSDPARADNDNSNPMFRKITEVLKLLEDMPNQRSIHAGGVLISEESIYYYTALDMPPKGMPTVQWDMYEAELIGLDKFDVLSQRGIGHIREAVEIILKNRKIKVDVHDVKTFVVDEKVNEQLKSGDTIGCFYIESPAMRQLLKKLRCADYRTLVAASSIIRPGVASSGMMGNYIFYFHHPDKVEYLHPVMKEQLKETYGVMVYQEDVIKVCMHYAGMDGSDADILRRGMSGKYRSRVEFDKLVEKFHNGAKALDRPEPTTKEVWRQVSSFAGYSFSKAHSASFAVESYQSLLLKTYYPKEFMVAVLNNYGGFYSRWLYVHELQKAGATVHLPCVNESEAKVCIKGDQAYLGFIGMQGLEQKFIELIPAERGARGKFNGLEDFICRTSITLEQCLILIRAGAFRFTGHTKKELLWEVHNYLGQKSKKLEGMELFNVPVKSYQYPDLPDDLIENAYQELEILGFTISIPMTELLKTGFRGEVMASELMGCIGKTVKMVGEYVCDKTVHTKNNKTMWFGTFLDKDGQFFDTTHFPNSAPRYPFRGKGCYLILGKVVEDFGYPSIEVVRFAKLPIVPNPILS
ncbi:DNA polymerase III subunit alpha [Pedobacter sp. ASV28]|uniref:DNA polymerase III subunit alpha n=1 Tax=Pedobacter sp. ASV28 TaxID=2795123 RepID=UPI0018EC53E7|nr:DNA polymerase III subunit alpha [Pedobacter sp. ASV28]